MTIYIPPDLIGLLLIAVGLAGFFSGDGPHAGMAWGLLLMLAGVSTILIW